jgi:hypothetical protein
MAQNLPLFRNVHFTNGPAQTIMGASQKPRRHNMFKCFALSALCAFFVVGSFAQEPVFINEFMANNATGLLDETGDRQDWIELRNTSASPVNLTGYYLTDTASNLKRWRIASGSIPANGYLVIFASGDNRQTPRLHTDFSLDADGEYLAFVKPDGVTKISEFSATFPQQYKDTSYGLDATGTNWVYFSTATPNAANTGGVVAFAKDTKFSQDRGYYDAPFDLAITTETVGATIRYTTNGTVPTASNGFIYDPGTGIRISGTTVIRASAFKTGFQPSPPDSQTYLFLNDVIRQAANGQAPPGWPTSWGNNVVDYGMDTNVVNDPLYRDTIVNDLKTLPSVSIVMNLSDLFNLTTGIYANPRSDGRAWERPCTVEYLRTDGVEGFRVNAGIRIRGGFSRDTANPKHAFRLFFREEYGDGKLKYPLFGDNGADEFDKIDLRTFQNYSWSYQGDPNGVFIRDVFSRDTQLAMGHQAERGDYCFLYINGMFWGIYNTCERPEAAYGETYWGGREENYDTVKVEAGPYTINATDGNLDAWQDLYDKATAGLSTDVAYWNVQGRNSDGSRNPGIPNLIDIENLIDYMLVIFYGGNKDAPISNFLGNDRPNNWYGLRDRTGDAGFRFFAHDSEHTLLPGDIGIDRTGPFAAGQNGFVYSNPQYIFQQLADHPEFRLKIADRIHKYYFNNGLLTPASAAARFRKRMAELDRAVVAESARWGDAKREPPITRNHWVNACNNVLNNFLPRRSATNMIQYRNQGWYPNVVAPTFNQHGGNVAAGFQLTITAPSSTIYYTVDGTDPRLFGGGVAPTARTYTGAVRIDSSAKVKSRVRNSSGTWSALNEADFYVIRNFTNLMITEINYRPITAQGVEANEWEFIELKNTSTTEMDLSGIRFTNGISYTFPLGKKLSPGKFIVLARNAAAFATRYPGVTIDGVYTNKLDDAGETVTLVHAAGAPIFSVTYGDLSPWPISADGGGFSLVPKDANLNPNPNNAANWRASAQFGGSPGQDDPPVNVLPIHVNEALTHTDLPTVDAIELYNPNFEPVDVGGWYLTDDRLTPKKFRIPSPKWIDPHSYVVFTEADFNTGTDATNFSLSSHGDEVFLYSGDPAGNLTGYSDGFNFDGAENAVTFGRYTNSIGEVQFPAQLQNTLGAVNSGPRVGSVVINEIRYWPKLGDEEFIELRNLTGSAIKLYDPNHPTNLWRISGIDFTFPAGAEIPANGYVVIASVDPSLFRAHNAVPAGVPIFGPYNGALQDDGELLELKRPDAPDLEGVSYIVVDAVRYNDRAPWPLAAAGIGPSLERANSAAYGNDPVNWRASNGPASPGLDNNGNRPPQVDAGLDGGSTATTFPVDIPLSPTVSDDGFPAPAQLTYTWSQVSGPGVVVFANANARNTTASLPGVGRYVLRLTVSDGELSASDTVEFQLDRPLSGMTFVAPRSTWKYRDDNSNQGTGWRAETFNDSTWAAGPARLGYSNSGEDGEVTTVNGGPVGGRYMTTYFRRTFNVASVSGLRDLTVSIQRDDGAVVYLNGQEIMRENLPEGVTITSSTPANGAIGGADEQAWISRPVSTTLLKAGANTLAVEMHQSGPGSSDLGFDLQLTGSVSSQNTAPIVNAGQDIPITLPAVADLAGSVIDDGLPLPPGAPNNTWSKVSGPGTVIFDNAASPRTVARFSIAGTYVLRLTSNDGEFTRTDDLTVNVAPGDAYAAWKSTHFTAAELGNPNISGDNADPDGDTFGNAAEYLAGTNPRNGQSYLSLSALPTQTGVGLVFTAMPERGYDLYARESVDSGIWEVVRSIQPGASEQTMQVNVDVITDEVSRYFKLSVPAPQ